jgi:hypothetical protein
MWKASGGEAAIVTGCGMKDEDDDDNGDDA